MNSTFQSISRLGMLTREIDEKTNSKFCKQVLQKEPRRFLKTPRELIITYNQILQKAALEGVDPRFAYMEASQLNFEFDSEQAKSEFLRGYNILPSDAKPYYFKNSFPEIILSIRQNVARLELGGESIFVGETKTKKDNLLNPFTLEETLYLVKKDRFDMFFEEDADLEGSIKEKLNKM